MAVCVAYGLVVVLCVEEEHFGNINGCHDGRFDKLETGHYMWGL